MLIPNSFLINKLSKSYPEIKGLISGLSRFNILQGMISLAFFSIYYSLMSPLKLSLKESFKGALSFVALYMIGKSFYWIYLHYFKADIKQQYGDFHTLIVAVIWAYYIISSFFYGACVACVNHYGVMGKNNTRPKQSVRGKSVRRKPAPVSEVPPPHPQNKSKAA